MSIIWNTRLETGHRQIDLQHQELVELINEADAGHAAERDTEVLQEIMPRLLAYALFHFATEDKLMTSSAVAAAHAKEHRQAHQAFVDRVSALKKSIETGETELLEPLISYLQDWLVEHIMKTDRVLVHELAKKR